MTNFTLVEDFNDAMEVERSMTPRNIMLRLKLINEEVTELFEECYSYNEDLDEVEIHKNLNRQQIAKELADILYVTYGAADCFGIAIDDVFEAVHESNMSKLDADRKPIRREDGKVMKGPNYAPPDLSFID